MFYKKSVQNEWALFFMDYLVNFDTVPLCHY